MDSTAASDRFVRYTSLLFQNCPAPSPFHIFFIIQLTQKNNHPPLKRHFRGGKMLVSRKFQRNSP